MRGTLFIAVVLTLASVELADAATFFTPIARAEAGSTLNCRAINVGKKPIAITVKRGDLNGVNDQTVCTSVLPGSGCPLPANGPAVGYCQFDVDGGRKSVRAALTVEDSTGTRILIEAR